MFRWLLLLIALVSIAVSCMGQTFQYSDGWKGGKRALTSPGISVVGNHLPRNDDALLELYELQDGDYKLQRCLLQLQRFVRNPLIFHSPNFLTVADDGLNPPVESNDYIKH